MEMATQRVKREMATHGVKREIVTQGVKKYRLTRTTRLLILVAMMVVIQQTGITIIRVM